MSKASSNQDEVFERVLRLLVGHLNMIMIYPPGHPALEKNLKNLFELLNHFLEPAEIFSFSVVDQEIVYQNRPFIALSKKFPSLIRFFEEKGFSQLTFTSGLKISELEKFYNEMVLNKGMAQKGESWNAQLKKWDIVHIQCEFLSSDVSGVGDDALSDETGTEEDLEKILKSIMDAGWEGIQALQEMFASGKNLDFEYLSHTVNLITPQVLKHYEDLFFLGKLKTHHEYTFEHDMNVAVLSCMLGAQVGLIPSVLEGICMAAFLHDIGKSCIPLEILDKKGKLDERETLIMRRHSQGGAKMILFQGLGDIPATVAFEHHFNFDGAGYPKMFRERPQSLATRIVIIADVYDALRGKSEYKDPTSPEEIYKIMQKEKGRRFDPCLLDLFFQTIGVYPPGTEVKLNTGERGISAKVNPIDIFRPEIRIVTDREGTSLDEPFQVSLMEKEGGHFVRTVDRSIMPTYA